MTIKEVKPINFIFFRTDATVNELYKLLPVGQELFKEAVAHNLPITGPVHWHYFGFNGDPNQTFQLEIALPVGEILDEYDGKFHFKRTAPFKCVSSVHEGAWDEIPYTYDKMMQFIFKHKMEASAINREIYVNTDFDSPDANVTEIQIGLN